MFNSQPSEPLFLSPFLQGISSCEDHSGIFGVNALNFTINFVGRHWGFKGLAERKGGQRG
jgi:hypothetical protein